MRRIASFCSKTGTHGNIITSLEHDWVHGRLALKTRAAIRMRLPRRYLETVGIVYKVLYVHVAPFLHPTGKGQPA